jgi:Protein of unknown function (DUF1236)
MKRVFIAAATIAAVAIGASNSALPQGVGVQVGPVGVGVTFAPEQRTRIKEYVVKERVAPVTVREKIVVGAKVPADVELRAVPTEWGPSVVKYRYVYSDDHVYLVEPSSREVVAVVD